MCIDSDLFGDVIVTKSDVTFWLDTTALMQCRSKSSREYYAQFYDVASKIKLSKLNGSFAKLINKHENRLQYDDASMELYATKYVTLACDEKKTRVCRFILLLF
jgi:hypothetical protein